MEYTSKEVYEYVSKKSNDPIVERKKCRLSGQEFPIYKSDLEFYDKVSPVFGGKSFKIPIPNLCPEERNRMRYSRKNLGKLYNRVCNFSGKHILSIYSPDKPYHIYENVFRWHHSGSNSIFRDFEEGKSLGSQLYELLKEAPLMNLSSVNVENSAYNHIILNSKNCYLCFSTGDSHDCQYLTLSARDVNCIDGYRVLNSENCYENVYCNKCFNSFYINFCSNCNHLYYCDNCSGCEECYFCTNLQNKKYCILNIQYTKQDYEDIIKTFGKKEVFKKYFKNYELLSQDFVYDRNANSQKSFGGNNVNSNNCIFCFETTSCNDCRYCINIGLDVNKCLDCSGGDIFKSEFCYECVGVSNSYNILFGYNCINCSNLIYCFECYNCKNCFGCIGLQNKEYCILNKQYTKQEYEQNVIKIIETMQDSGERGYPMNQQFFPFCYNETIAMDYYPLTKEEAIKMGYKRSDYESPMPHVEKIVEGSKLPTQGCKIIQEKKPEILEKIVNYAVICEVSKKPFRITKQEIDFYIKHNLPLPTKHPDVRHQERLARKDPTTMHLIHCDECGEEMLSVHLPGEGKKILCEKCFYKNK